jgi:hypothetical protein
MISVLTAMKKLRKMIYYFLFIIIIALFIYYPILILTGRKKRPNSNLSLIMQDYKSGILEDIKQQVQRLVFDQHFNYVNNSFN